MKLSSIAVVTAIRQHLGGFLATECERRIGNTPDLSDTDLGELLMRCIGHGPERSDLSSLSVFAGPALALTADDTLSHPLFGRWAKETLAQALCAPIIAGARAMSLDPYAPTFGNMLLTQIDGQISGQAWLEFNLPDQLLIVILNYGAPSGPNGFLTTRTFSGEALQAVGVTAREATQPKPKGDLESLVRSFQLGSGSLH